MATDPTELADRLLEAQVSFVVAECTGAGAAAMLASEVRDALDRVSDVPLCRVLPLEAVQATARVALDTAAGSAAVGAMAAELVPLLRELPAHRQHRLGDVVTWGAVEAIVDVLIRSEQLREEVLERLGRSPAVSTLAMRFVAALVGDAVQQNRERAEKVPGMKSVLGMGDLAARTARGMAPKQLGKVVGDAADRGANAAMERVRRALVETFDEDVVRDAVMEVWGLHAEDDVAGLQAYLTPEDVRHVAVSGHALWLDLCATTWFGAVVDAAVEAFFERYGDLPVGAVLAEFGLDRDTIAAEVERHAPPVLDALARRGHVEAMVRRRLAPFFRSELALELLSDTD